MKKLASETEAAKNITDDQSKDQIDELVLTFVNGKARYSTPSGKMIQTRRAEKLIGDGEFIGAAACLKPAPSGFALPRSRCRK